MPKEPRPAAVNNLASGIYLNERLPMRVIAPQYREIYVADFRRLFAQDTGKLFKALMTFEDANTAAVACFQRSTATMRAPQHDAMDWREDLFFLSPDTDDEAYWSFIRRNLSEFGQRTATPEMLPPWLVFAEIIGACTDLGGWYIYCEKVWEIALLGFLENPGVFMERRLLAEFGIDKLSRALDGRMFFADHESEFAKSQLEILRQSYIL